MPADLTPAQALDEIRALADDFENKAEYLSSDAVWQGQGEVVNAVRAILARVTPSETLECVHCPDGHRPHQAWAVYVAPQVDNDGQPTRIFVEPNAGAHVAESDAQWIRELLNPLTVTPPAVPGAGEVERVARALNLDGYTCDGGGHEPGHYGDCPDCTRILDQAARAAITALRDGEVGGE